MPRPHVALLDASTGDPHVHRNFKRELDATLTIFHIQKGEIPPSLAPEDDVNPDGPELIPPYDAVVITGSGSVASDGEPWMAPLATWTSQVIAMGLPVLGIGWGHQFLVQLLGGTIGPQEYEIGYVEIEQTKPDPLFEGLSNPFVAFATHAQGVTLLPTTATLIARNEAGIQAFRQDRVYGIQFHPEYDLRTAEDTIQHVDLSMHEVQKALHSVIPKRANAAQTTKRIFSNYLRFVEELRKKRLRESK